MELYIDHENVLSFIEQKEHVQYADCLKLMQKQLDVYFNFPKETLLEDEILMAWFTFFTSGVGANSKQTFIAEKFPPRPVKSNSYITFSQIQLSAIYLITDEKLEILKEKGAVLVGGPGEEIAIFNYIFFNNNDYKFDRKLAIGSADFNSWEQLQKYSISASDILFIDGFILIDDAAIDYNLIPFLRVIACKAKCKINIVLYTNYDNVNVTYDVISEKVRNAVSAQTGIKPNLTIIKYRDKRDVASYAEHDRTVFTNYYRVYSGDTFNYFKADGTKRTKGREVHFHSFGLKENHDLALRLISDIQNNINSLPGENIEGDKKSNFLNFP